jgi:hypothetical protein
MRRVCIAVAFLAVVALGTSFAFSQRGDDHRGQGVLSVLSKGQAVSVKDAGGRYEIGILPNVETLGYKVVDVGADFVVVEDIAQVTQLRIPIYSIKAVSILKVGRTDN